MNNEIKDTSNDVQIVNVEVVENVPQLPLEFTMGVHQKYINKKGEEKEYNYSLKFELPESIANNADIVVGTAINRLFQKMELAKAHKTKLFDSTRPIMLKIESKFLVNPLDLGQMAVTETYIEKYKLGNSVGSRFNFAQRLSALITDFGKPLQIVSLNSEVIAPLREQYLNDLAVRNELLTLKRAEKAALVVE